MALVQGVLVEVISEDHSLPCYPDRDKIGDDSGISAKPTFYIEAKTDAKFHVRVTLTETFQWLSGNGVRVYLGFDGGDMWHWKFYQESWLNGGNSLSRILTSFPEYDPQTKAHRQARFSFGHLELQESHDDDDNMPDSVDQLGTISIEIERVNLSPCLNPRVQEYPQEKSLERVSVASEKVLKGKAVTNTVKMVTGEVLSPPRIIYDCTTLVGNDGKLFSIEFLYRSRHVLQMLGYIPKTPSPESALASPPEATSSSIVHDLTAPADVDGEIRQLRERLAKLEKKREVKSEFRDLYEDSSIPPKLVKRQEVDDPEVWEVKRRRVSQPTEVVDLTGD